MTKSSQWALGVVVAVTLAVPSWAFGQTAVRRTDPPSGSSSGGGSSGSSGSSSSGSSSGSSSSGSEARTPPPPPSFDPPRAPSRIPTTEQRSGSSSSRTGTATSRSNPAPAGGSDAGTRSRGSSGSSSVSGPESNRTPLGAAFGRDRGNRPITGQAIERPFISTNPDITLNLIFSRWNTWSPYYGYGYGYNYYGYGCGAYCYPGSRWAWDPWYGSSWGRWGYFDPWDPYDPYGYSTSRSDEYDEAPRRAIGSIRLKAKPADAKVYIDGVLVGVIDDFDGFTNHLELDAGPHQLEVRADGYETLMKDIVVKQGRTMTERLSLRKK
jgi:hypothetical protein